MLMHGIEFYKKELIAKKALQKNALQRSDQIKTDIERAKKSLSDIEQAGLIIQQVSKDTQEQIEYRISELVTLALKSIFPDPYRFKLIYESKRGKTEASFRLFRGEGDTIGVDPLSSVGGGVIDVIALALRITIQGLSSTRKIIILDEPLKFLSKGLKEKAAELIKQLSQELGLQIIMTTHVDEFIDSADKVFSVSQTNGISSVKEVQ